MRFLTMLGLGLAQGGQPKRKGDEHQRHPRSGEASRGGRNACDCGFQHFQDGMSRHTGGATASQGEAVQDKVVLPTEIIDKMNYQDWLVPMADRSCPKWDEVVR
jgi:hypothetical protein